MPTKSARTRERILNAAAFVLSRKGYAGTRLSEVAEVAEVQTPAIYYYFDSRDELVEEVMWVGAHLIRLHVEQTVAELTEHSITQKILAGIEAHLQYELQISDYTTASIRNAGQVPEHLRVRPAAEESLYSRFWRDLLLEAQEEGLLREGLDINIYRLLLLGALNWAAEWWNPRTKSFKDLVREAQNMVRFGTFADPHAID